MTKRGITTRLAIAFVIVMFVACLAFAELGIATAFDMKFDGMTYMEYTKEFYSVPWHFTTGAAVVLIALGLSTELMYRSCFRVKDKTE